MNFDLSETQELFRETAERFARTVEVADREKIRALAGGYDRSRWSELAELGLLAISASEEQGGLSGTTSDLSTIAETMGLNNAIDPWLENGALPVRLLSSANHQAVLESVLDGSQLATLAFAEPGRRYQLFPHNTEARASDDGKGYVISGNKHFVMGGAQADVLLVTANIDGEFALFSVAADNRGIDSKPYRISDGGQAAQINFNQVAVSEDARLDLSNEQFQEVIAEVAVLCCAEMVGLSQRVLNDTLAYVKEREQFNVAIGSFQVIQHGLVDCYSELEQMRSLLYRTLLLDDTPAHEWSANVMGAKAFISEGAISVARTAVQYHGAMGITDEVAIGHAFKRIILLARLFGDAADNLKQFMEVA